MKISTEPLEAGENRFDVTLLAPSGRPRRAVLFAAGRGGHPGRYLGLLKALAMEGSLVIAPHFDMIASPMPSEADLDVRHNRLIAAQNLHAPTDLPLCGVGHSIGTVLLLILAGAIATTHAREQVMGRAPRPFERLALFTPPTAFFHAPGALDGLRVAISIWAGGADTITPPDHARFLASALEGRTAVTLKIIEEAGHFTFMNDLPPGITDPHPNRTAFLENLAAVVSDNLQAGSAP